MNVYELARELNVIGAVIQAHIDPNRIPVRTKRSAQRMIRSGIMKGGWSSKAKQLALKLVEGTSVPVLRNSWRQNEFAIEPLPPEAIARLDEMFEADIALAKMTSDFNELNENNRKWRTENWEHNLNWNKKMIRQLSRTPTEFRLAFESRAYQTEAFEYIMSFSTAEDKAELARIASLLDRDAPIPLTPITP